MSETTPTDGPLGKPKAASITIADIATLAMVQGVRQASGDATLTGAGRRLIWLGYEAWKTARATRGIQTPATGNTGARDGTDTD